MKLIYDLPRPQVRDKAVDTMIHIYPQPMSLVQPEPFDNWDWIYEIKYDGFRALAVIEQGQCRFFSRKKRKLTGHQDLRTALVKEVSAETPSWMASSSWSIISAEASSQPSLTDEISETTSR